MSTFHYIVVEHADTASEDGDLGFYGPYPTRQCAETAIAEHPGTTEMSVVGLQRLAPIVDPFVAHPNSGGV